MRGEYKQVDTETFYKILTTNYIHGETFLFVAAHIPHAIANIWAAYTLIMELKNA